MSGFLYLLALLLAQQVADLDELFTVADVAKIARISRSTVYALVASGELSPVKWQLRKTRFTKAEILRFLGDDAEPKAVGG